MTTHGTDVAPAHDGSRDGIRLDPVEAAVAAIRAGWGVGCLNTSAIPPDLAVLSRHDTRHWPSPGRLSFYLLSRPAARRLAHALTAWAR